VHLEERERLAILVAAYLLHATPPIYPEVSVNGAGRSGDSV
jgi:hypothetical protein